MKNQIPGLNALRAIAAMVVVLAHIEILKQNFTPFKNCATTVPSGINGVNLFFVISGYLITTLLLKEKAKFGAINIKKFYVRRILRIWPLYYFVLLSSALLFSYKPPVSTLVYCLTILPNIAHMFMTGWTVSPQIWSIGVEEQFYIIWPTLVKFSRSGFLFILIAAITGLTLLPHVLLFVLHKTGHGGGNTGLYITRFFFNARFNVMAMGGLLAYITVFYPQYLAFVKTKVFSYLFIIVPLVLWGINFEAGLFTAEVFGVLFCLLVAAVAANNYTLFNNGLADYLGKISYGIYMYHWIVILGFFKFVYPHLAITNAFLFNCCLYIFSIGGTIGVASLSYYYFEDYFLKLKTKFEQV